MGHAEQDLNATGIIEEANFNRLEIAFNYLSKYIELLDEEQAEKRADALARRGMIYNSWNEDDKGIKDLEKAHELAPENPIILKNLSLTCWMLDTYQEALIYLRKLKELTPQDKDIDILLAEIHIRSGDPQQAVNDLGASIANRKKEKPDYRLLSTLIKAYDKNFQTIEAQQKLSEYEDTYGLEPELLLAKANHLVEVNQYNEAVKIFDAIIESSEGKVKSHATLLLADLLFEVEEIQNYERAAELYKRFSNVHRIDRNLKRYAFSLYQAKKYLQCMQLCQTAQQIHKKFIDELAEVEARIYTDTENFKSASEILSRLAKKNPNHISYLVNLAYSLYRSGQFEEAFNVVLQAEGKVENAQEIAFISSSYESIGDLEKAIELAWEALQKDPNDPNLHLHYIYLFQRAQNTITDFKEHHRNTYQDSLEHFNERFPEERSIIKQEVSNDPDQLHRQFKEFLTDFPQKRQRFETAYQTHQLPLGFLVSWCW